MNKIDFLQGFLRSPLEVGSIIPSSKFMVKKIADHVVKEKPETVVELGAGTGVLTRELNKSCRPNTSLIVFEKDKKMREELNNEFPHLSIYSDALSLPEILDDLGIQQVDCIVCGLPFTLFPRSKTEQIFKNIHSQLKSNGCFIMYQYTRQLKKRLTQLFDQVSTKLVLLNIPPTFIFFCKKL